MKAVVIRTFGDPDGLEVVEVPVPVPARGQVRIATEAIGAGGVDAVIRRGVLAGHGFRAGPSQAAPAHRRMDAGEVFGRVVLAP